jgi:sialate O-acetylesterase
MKNRSSQHPPPSTDIWIMAGQSNMEGCGSLKESLPPNPRVWCFNLQHQWTIARDPLHELAQSAAPVNWQLLQRAAPPDIFAKGEAAVRQYWAQFRIGIGAGLGLAFGSAYTKATKRPVGLIAAAHGGTTMEDWNPLGRDSGLSSLYGALLERVRLAGGNLAGLLWYQGESDAETNSLTYQDHFEDWIHALRRDLGRPRLPIVTVQLGPVVDPHRSAAGWNRIRMAQYNMPDLLPHVALTSAVDLGLNDAIHIDTPGLIRLGRRMAHLALGLHGKPTIAAKGIRFQKLVTRVNSRSMGETDLYFTGVTGAWNPERQITGFSLQGADGQPHRENGVTAAFRHPKKQAVIVVRTMTPLKEGDRIVYGDGLSPHCNAVDNADMALPAFTAIVN